MLAATDGVFSNLYDSDIVSRLSMLKVRIVGHVFTLYGYSYVIVFNASDIIDLGDDFLCIHDIVNFAPLRLLV